MLVGPHLLFSSSRTTENPGCRIIFQISAHVLLFSPPKPIIPITRSFESFPGPSPSYTATFGKLRANSSHVPTRPHSCLPLHFYSMEIKTPHLPLTQVSSTLCSTFCTRDTHSRKPHGLLTIRPPNRLAAFRHPIATDHHVVQAGP